MKNITQQKVHGSVIHFGFEKNTNKHKTTTTNQLYLRSFVSLQEVRETNKEINGRKEAAGETWAQFTNHGRIRNYCGSSQDRERKDWTLMIFLTHLSLCFKF